MLGEERTIQPEVLPLNGKRRILVVDDEPVIADTLVTILNGNGFSAQAAYDGASALDLVALSPPDLLITDVSMPGMNGIDLAIKVRELFPDCKVLLFSGHAATAGLLNDVIPAGHHFELLSKPLHPRDLLDRLNGSSLGSPKK